jgi:hypothetical protein
MVEVLDLSSMSASALDFAKAKEDDERRTAKAKLQELREFVESDDHANEDTKATIEQLQKSLDKAPVTEAKPRDLGRVITPEGVYILCTEGVGPKDPLGPDDEFTVDFWLSGSRPERDEQTEDGWKTVGWTSIFPTVTATLTGDEIAELPVTEELPLHEFIRTFGARLETNFAIWSKTLSSACPV